MSLARSLTISRSLSRFLCIIRFTRRFIPALLCAGLLSSSNAGISNEIHAVYDSCPFVFADRVLCRLRGGRAQDGAIAPGGHPGGGVVHTFFQSGEANERGI